MLRVAPEDPGWGVFEYGCHLCTDHWGHGWATEAGRRIIAHAFEDLGVASLFAGHNPTHEEFYPGTGLMHPSYTLKRRAWTRG